MEVNLKMADLYNSYCGISNDANRSLVFTEILTKKVEGMYKRAGPRGLPLKTFILFVIEFLQAIGENAAIAPRVTTLDWQPSFTSHALIIQMLRSCSYCNPDYV